MCAAAATAVSGHKVAHLHVCSHFTANLSFSPPFHVLGRFLVQKDSPRELCSLPQLDFNLKCAVCVCV